MFSSKYVRFSTIGVYRHRLLITLIQLETHVHLYTPETENDEEEEPKMSVVAASSTLGQSWKGNGERDGKGGL